MSRRHCAYCAHCLGECIKHPRLGEGAGYESMYPDETCNLFQPDIVRAGDTSRDDFYHACATCKFYKPYCNIYEGTRYNDSPICHNYEDYVNRDW